jgi:hypothetical protein
MKTIDWLYKFLMGPFHCCNNIVKDLMNLLDALRVAKIAMQHPPPLLLFILCLVEMMFM